jgi:hypothetical protein
MAVIFHFWVINSIVHFFFLSNLYNIMTFREFLQLEGGFYSDEQAPEYARRKKSPAEERGVARPAAGPHGANLGVGRGATMGGSSAFMKKKMKRKMKRR